ncbi:Uncharacterized protein APZ42_032964 [Daphnia magna]|uniref:Uncharacterized protein n=1 Tax=Daphnia magna TaxID=35525 RepID=A0A164LHU7_9CRUS|nr:Uncharacterized protein APZ42_032964 [Daphnia magna]
MQTLPLTTQVGKITGIRLYTDAQLAIRQHKWKKKISGRAKGDACLPMKKNLVNYALRTAWNMQLNGTTQSDITQNSLENFSPFVSENFTVPLHFSKGWARRPKNGQMYGPKHVLIYRPDILEMFKLGEEDKKNKRSPAQMLKMLAVKYPQEFCLPSENDIRVEINRLQTKNKSPNVASKGERVIDIYDAFIREIAAKNVSLKPKDALTMTLQQFPRKENPNLPSDSKIRRKSRSRTSLCTTKHQATEKVGKPNINRRNFDDAEFQDQQRKDGLKWDVDRNKLLQDLLTQQQQAFAAQILQQKQAYTQQMQQLIAQNQATAQVVAAAARGAAALAPVLIQTHLCKFDSLVPVKSMTHVAALRRLQLTVRSHINALKTLGVQKDTFGGHLGTKLMKLLPAELHKELSSSDANDITDITALLNFIKDQVDATERYQAGRRLSRRSLATNRTVTFSTEESRFLSTSL